MFEALAKLLVYVFWEWVLLSLGLAAAALLIDIFVDIFPKGGD